MTRRMPPADTAFRGTAPRAPQSGIVLISSLLLLLVVTIMALSIFRSFGVQEKIAGNVRDKQRAVQSATSAQEYAEWWLANVSNAPLAVSNGSPASASTVCTSLLDANLGDGLICKAALSSIVASVRTVPWAIATRFSPATMNAGASGSATAADFYFDRPRFYLADAGAMPNGGELYKVDAYSYGSSGTTVAVVESTVQVIPGVGNVGNL
jgi:type IV pilus assembly protein PilX